MMMRYTFLWTLVVLLNLSILTLTVTATGSVLNFLEDFGAIPDDDSEEACHFNTDLLSSVLQNNATNNTLVIPDNTTFYLYHGVYAKHVNNTVIQIDGTLRWERIDYPYDDQPGGPPPCFMIDRSNNVTLTSKSSTGRGLLDGRGPQYWGIPMIGYLEIGENRPRLMRFNLTSNLLIENLIFQDSPYHTLYLEAVNHVEIRNISIVARRTERDGHGFLDLSALNTDGVDVSGSNVWVHDVDIWTQDDCIAVKDNFFEFESSNMTFERVNASGLGFVIGSIGGSTVKNITFRDSFLYKSVKGIYLKFNQPTYFWQERNLTGLIEDIRFENITMEEPLQWPIWIGPAQQADTINPCHPNPCSLCWPMTPRSRCHVVNKSKYRNIQLVNIRINNPRMSPGVILGSDDNEIESVVFDHVHVTKGDPVPYATQDRTVTFPGLLQPIRDPYIPGHIEENEWLGDFINPSFIIPRESVDLNDDEKEIMENETLLELLRMDALCLALFVSLVWTLYSVYRVHAQSRTFQPTEKDQLEEPLLLSQSKPQSQSIWAGYGLLLGLFANVSLCTLVWMVYADSAMPKPKWDRTSRYYACRGVVNGIARGNTWPIPYCFEDDTPSRHDTLSRWYHFLTQDSVLLVAVSLLVISSGYVLYCLPAARRRDASSSGEKQCPK